MELPKILMARTTPHRASGVTPASLMFSREIHTKLPSMTQEKQEPKVTHQNHYRSYVENMKKYTDEKRNVKVHNFKIGGIDELMSKR